MKLIPFILVFAWFGRASIIDRVAISVEHTVITETQLDEEIRVTAFLNHQPIQRDLETRRAAADRLIEQELVRREMELSRYPFPTEQEVNDLLTAAQSEAGGASALTKLLSNYALTPEILKEHLGFQLTTLRFIEFRFKPDVEISEADIKEYYAKQEQQWKQTHTTPPPSLADSRAAIEQALTGQRVDYALSAWLEETRKQVTIVYLNKELQ